LQEESAEFQQAETLWEVFCDAKSQLNGIETCGDNDNEDDDDDNSRFSSATDDVSRSAIAGGDSIMECLKVPVLKLKVANYVDGTTVINSESGDRAPSQGIASSVVTPNECSSDFDAASESQSMSTTQGRLSSCSELDDQNTTEVFAYT
jgi:hypothetical protein